MNRSTVIPRSRDSRRGTTVVETALVLPLFFFFVLVLIEVGHVMMVRNMLHSACRAGARMGTVDGSSTNDIEQFVTNRLASAVKNPSAVEVFIKDASVFDEGGTPPESGAELEELPDIELASAESRQLFLVRAKVTYGEIALVPFIPMLGDRFRQIVLGGQAFMRRE